jgi:iron complex outermembrane receptor protein
MKPIFRFFQFFLVAAFLTVTVRAQATKPVIEGSVLDGAGARISGASLILRAPGQPVVTASSDSEGHFRLEARTHGAQELSITAPGFTARVLSVNLAPGSTTPIAARLEPVQFRQDVTVIDRVSTISVQTENTATRMNIPLMNLPQSVSIVTNIVMAEQAVVTPGEALRNVAGVRQAGTYLGTYERLTLRGFTQSQISTYFRNGARFVMLATPNVAAAEQIEVLKGPASIQYGTVIPGGVINIVSKKPQEQMHGEFTYRPGSFNSHEGFADITGPISSKHDLYYRLNLYGRKADSYRDLIYNDGYLFNPSLLWRPLKRTTISADMELDRLFMLFDPGLPAPDGRTFSSVTTLPRDLYIGHPDATFRSMRRFYSIDVNQELWGGWAARARYNYSAFSRDRNWLNNSSFNVATQTVLQDIWPTLQGYSNYFGQLDVLGTVRASWMTHTILLGGDTLTVRQFTNNAPTLTGFPVSVIRPDYSRPMPFVASSVATAGPKNYQKGGFIQDNISLGNKVNVLAGFRYTSLEQQGSPSDRNLAPRVGAVFHPIQWMSVYGSYSESFEPNIGFTFTNTPYFPSLGKQVEVGLKNQFLSNRLTATFAWFDLRRTNVLTPDPDHTGYSIQSGEQRSRGVELEVKGDLTRRWQVIGAYAFTSARITKDNRYLAGTVLPLAPRHNANLWTTYHFTSFGQPLSVGAGVFYTDAYYESLNNRYQIPGYTLVDLNASWRFRERYKLQFNVKNLFNKLYYTDGSNLNAIFPGPPRAFTGTVSARF